MSRLLYVVALVLLLTVSVSCFPFVDHHSVVPSHDLADPSACPNACSSHGICVQGVNGTSCICDERFLGSDCSVQVTMDAVCWLNNTVCSYWQIQNGLFYQRLSAMTNGSDGWVGFMFGATDGMAGGQATVLSVHSAYTATAEEMFAEKKGKPSLLPDQTISSMDVSGLSYKTGLDVTYQRQVDPKRPQHFVIPTTPGIITNVSVAYSSIYFNFHMKNAVFLHLDLAKMAQQNAPITDTNPASSQSFINKRVHRRSTNSM